MSKAGAGTTARITTRARARTERTAEVEKEIELLTPIHTIAELESALGAGTLARVAGEALDGEQVPERDGERRIEEHWGYDSVDALGTWLANHIADRSDFAGEPRPAEEILAEFENAYREHAERTWLLEAEQYEMCRLAEAVQEQCMESLQRDIDIPLPEWHEYLFAELDVFYDDGIALAMEDVLLDVEVTFCIADEWNRDYTSIMRAANEVIADRSPDGRLVGVALDEEDVALLNDNSLLWLMSTQGYDWGEFVERIGSTEPFWESLRSELAECSYRMEALTLCCTMSIKQYAALASGEANFEIDPSGRYFTLGFHNRWEGAGGILALAPDTPFVIGREIIGDITPEGLTQAKCYTIDKSHGLCSECWSETVLIPTERQVVPPPRQDLAKLEAALARLCSSTPCASPAADIGRARTAAVAPTPAVAPAKASGTR